MRALYRIAAVAFALLVIAAVGSFYAKSESASQSARLPVMSDVGGDFELTGAGGARVHLHEYRGRAVLLFFGYMHCPDVCPTGLYTLKGVLDELGDAAGRVQVIMVTVDPERDTPEALERYVQYFHPQFVGLSGAAQEIDTVARQYRVYRQKVATPSVERVNHSAYVYLLDAQQQVRAVFSADAKPAEIADGVRQVLHENENRG